MSEANDFLVDGIYTFEIGGKRKRYSPIEGYRTVLSLRMI